MYTPVTPQQAYYLSEEFMHIMNSEDFKKLDKIDLPYVIKDKILMSPGFWKNYNYTSTVIEHGFKNTDFSKKEVRSLFLDHEDQSANSWIGEVTNAYFDGANVKGDLVIVDENVARKLAYGAKFGISPKIVGEATESEMTDFNFENFSVVMVPAVKTAYINNSAEKPAEKIEPKKAEDNIIKEGENMAEEIKQPEAPKIEVPAEVPAPAPAPEVLSKADEELAEELSRYKVFVEKFGVLFDEFKGVKKEELSAVPSREELSAEDVKKILDKIDESGKKVEKLETEVTKLKDEMNRPAPQALKQVQEMKEETFQGDTNQAMLKLLQDKIAKKI